MDDYMDLKSIDYQWIDWWISRENKKKFRELIKVQLILSSWDNFFQFSNPKVFHLLNPSNNYSSKANVNEIFSKFKLKFECELKEKNNSMYINVHINFMFHCTKLAI